MSSTPTGDPKQTSNVASEPTANTTPLAEQLTADVLHQWKEQSLTPSAGQLETLRSVAQLIELHQETEDQEKPAVAVVTGLSGSGKSELLSAVKEVLDNPTVTILSDGTNPVEYVKNTANPGELVIVSQLVGQAEWAGLTSEQLNVSVEQIYHRGFSAEDLAEFLRSGDIEHTKRSLPELAEHGVSAESIAAHSLGSRVLAERLTYRVWNEVVGGGLGPEQSLRRQASNLLSGQLFRAEELTAEQVQAALSPFTDTAFESDFSEVLALRQQNQVKLFEDLAQLPLSSGGEFSAVNRYRELIYQESLAWNPEARIVITAFGLTAEDMTSFQSEWQDNFQLVDEMFGGRPPRKTCFWLCADIDDYPVELFDAGDAPSDMDIEMYGLRNFPNQRIASTEPGRLLQYESGDHDLTNDTLRASAAVEALLQFKEMVYLVSVQSRDEAIIPTRYWLHQPQHARFIEVSEPTGAPLFDSAGELL